MIKALWLTSWYPNRLNAMNGDFIQRHARAVSLFCKVDIIHLEADNGNSLSTDIEASRKDEGNLSEMIVLYKRNNRASLLGKLFAGRRYVSIFKKQIKQYLASNGRPDIVHVHIPMKAGILALWLKDKYGIPYVVTEHWTIYSETAEHAYSKRSFFFKYLTQKIFKNAAVFLPVSNSLGKAVQRMVLPVCFTAIPNVADTDYFKNVLSVATDKKMFRFVHVSTLNYQKNVNGIVNAFAKFCEQYTSVQLVIIGENPGNLMEHASKQNISSDNISFTGLLSYEEVALTVRQCDAMIMFSRYENLPCVIIEALCCGLPVISTNVGGIPEIIDVSNGILVENEDENGLYQAMVRLYLNYDNYVKTNIAKKAQVKFSYRTVGKQIEQVYMDVISKASEIPLKR